MKSLYNVSNVKLFVYFSVLNIVISLLSRYYIVDSDVFFNTYSEQLTYSRAIEIFELTQRYTWISILVIPLLLLVKVFLVGVTLYIGFIFIGRMYSVTFSRLFKVVIIAELAFIACNLIKFFMIYLFKDYGNLFEINYYYPLSLATLFKYREIDPVWVYPFQTANLFQVFYMLLLSFGLRECCDLSGKEADKLVLSTYLPGLIIWILLIMFITSR